MRPKHLRLMYCILSITACSLSAMFSLASCGSAESQRNAPAQPPAGMDTGLAQLLPSPAEAVRRACGTSIELDGSGFDTGLPSQRVVAAAPLAVFSPDWDTAGSNDFSGLAFAVYSFNMFEYFGEPMVSVRWEGTPPATGDAWLGLANHTRGRWDWFAIPASGTIEIDQLADYKNGLTLMAAVAVIGTSELSLRRIWLGQQENGYFEIEDNDTYEQANSLPEFPFPSPVVNGSIGAAAGYSGYDGDGADWYSFSLPAPGAVAINIDLQVRGGSEYVSFDFKKDDGTGKPKDWRGYSSDGSPVSATVYFAAAGNYWLAVKSTSLAGEYTIALDYAPATLYETEDNDSWEQADVLPELPVGYGAVFGSVGHTDTPDSANGEVVYDGDNDDWYSFSVAERTLAAVELRCLGYSSTDHEIYMPDGVTLLAGKTGVHTPDRTVVMLPAAGTYFIRVMKSTTSTHVNYFLTVQAGTSGLGWMNVPVCSEEEAVSTDDCSLCLVDGHPAIAFIVMLGFDTTLAYTRALDAEGSAWGAMQYLDTAGGSRATGCSMAVVDGNPAIGFCVEGPMYMNLQYIRAADAQGTAWDGPSVLVDNSADYIGSGVSMAVINGQPALSYYQIESDHSLRYARALDAAGAAWGVPLDVFVSTDVNMYSDTTSMLTVEGRPAIAFVDPSGALAYCRAGDADGTTWSTPVELFRDADHRPSQVSMAVADGWPAVAFNTVWQAAGAGNHIRYIRAQDASGSAWGAALDLITEDDLFTAEDPSLAIIGGKPAIAFNGARLQYIAAGDASGSYWGIATTANDTNGSGVNPSLAEINGSAGIAHRMFAVDSLLYSGLF